MNKNIEEHVAQLGPGPLEERALARCIYPLFSRVLQREEIYLANHSLGRPLDQMVADVRRALDLWYEEMDGAWEQWLVELEAFRARIAELIHAPRTDCIIPKTRAGQGLRTILNCYDTKLRVVTTTAEFGSIDHILKVYGQRHRIECRYVKPDDAGLYHEEDLIKATDSETTLVVVSMVLFNTGQWFPHLGEIIKEIHRRGARILVDVYHAAGVIPMNIEALGADFAIGGCYKYLRGGPGACWLYVHPALLDGSMKTLDTGWFAQPQPFAFLRPEVPQFAIGGNAFLESTPPHLPYNQARAGLMLTLALGVEWIRDYSLKLPSRLAELLAQYHIRPLGQPDRRGGFINLPERSERHACYPSYHYQICWQ